MKESVGERERDGKRVREEWREVRREEVTEITAMSSSRTSIGWGSVERYLVVDWTRAVPV